MSFMYNQASKRNEELKRLFPDLTHEQLWFMIKLGRNTSTYCKSGAARDNYFSSVFKDVAQLSRVQKERDGKTYYGNKITIKGQEKDLIDDAE